MLGTGHEIDEMAWGDGPSWQVGWVGWVGWVGLASLWRSSYNNNVLEPGPTVALHSSRGPGMENPS